MNPSVEPPVLPSVAADGPRTPPRRLLRAAVIDFARFCAVLSCCIVCCILIVQPQLKNYLNEQADRAAERAEREDARAERAEVLLRSIASGVEVMTPPDNSKLFTILSKGVGNTEYAVYTDVTVGTTEEAAFAVDLTTYQQTDAWTQEFTIRNTDPGSDNLCWKPILWASAGANCGAKCAAATITCSGASTDGALLSPGQSVSRRFDGTSCLCVVGSAATNFQTERIVR